jgi:hypothetical protein
MIFVNFSMIFQATESRHRQMEETLADAKLLADRSNDNNDYYLQVSGQLICSPSNLSEMYFRRLLISLLLFPFCLVACGFNIGGC